MFVFNGGHALVCVHCFVDFRLWRGALISPLFEGLGPTKEELAKADEGREQKSGEAVDPCSDSACMEFAHIYHQFNSNLWATIPYMKHLGWRVWSTTNDRPSETSDLLESWMFSVYIFFRMLLSTDLRGKVIVTLWQWRHDTILCDMHWDALWWGSVIGGLLKDVGGWTPSIWRTGALPAFFFLVFFSFFLGFSEVKQPKTLKCLQPKKPWMPTWTCLAKWRSRVAEPENQSAPSTPTRHFIVLFLISVLFVLFLLFCLCAILCKFWSLWRRWTHPQTLLVPELAHQFGSLCSGSVHVFISKWIGRCSAFLQPWLRLTFFEVSKFWIQIKNDLTTVGRCCYCCFLRG